MANDAVLPASREDSRCGRDQEIDEKSILKKPCGAMSLSVTLDRMAFGEKKARNNSGMAIVPAI